MKLLTLLLIIILAAPILAQKSETEDLPSIAVMNFEAKGLTPSEAAAITERFVFEIMETKKFAVMERSQMNMILDELEFSQSDCVAQGCAIQAGQMISVRKIVTGSVSKVGGMFTVNARMLDVETGAIDKNVSEDCDCPVEKVFTVTLKRLARQLAGLKVGEVKTGIEIKRGDASLFIKTKPEGASVYLDGKLQEGRTPLNLENLMEGNHTLLVKKEGLEARKEVVLTRDRVERVKLKLGKKTTIVKVMSKPTEAEIYINKKPGIKSRPDQITPAILNKIKGDSIRLSLFKIGYRDTLLDLAINKNDINTFSVNMTEADVDYALGQKKMVKKRKQHFLGKYLSIASLACMAGGGVFYFLAQKDYDDARAAKEFLDNSVFTNDPKYRENLKINQEKSDSGDLKSSAGWAMLGVGAAGLAVGLYFYF